MRIKLKKSIFLFVIITFLTIFVIMGFWGNDTVSVNTVTVRNSKIPDNFNDYKIAQISDLHNTEFGGDNEILIEKLRECQPDIIVITGDLIDSYKTDIDIGIEFGVKSVEIAPTYFVTGNHEYRIDELNELEDGLKESGVIVLKDEKVIIEESGDKIALIGVDDPAFKKNYYFDKFDLWKGYDLQQLVGENKEDFCVLLSHRAELFGIYVKGGLDLVLSGHAHGGQIRLPLIGGLFAPEQGAFPKYDSGLYEQDGTSMVVSRGLGNSIFPFRFYNAPEIVVVQLQK